MLAKLPGSTAASWADTIAWADALVLLTPGEAAAAAVVSPPFVPAAFELLYLWCGTCAVDQEGDMS
jgi:hypothetical protein